MITYQHYTRGNQFGCRYCFDKVGDTIPMHTHEPEMYHDVYVVRGAVRVNSKVLYRGESYIPDNSRPHEIVALEPDTVLWNVYLNGKPEQYNKLSEKELGGVIGI
jgi:hypothetical protein